MTVSPGGGGLPGGASGGSLWGPSSWFGGPSDPTTGGTTASGAPVGDPGIAVYNHSTLGGWWAIKAPNGDIGIVRQTDLGPAPSTGRKFDYTYSLLPLFGYSQQTFPTNAQTYGVFLGKSLTDISLAFPRALSTLGATRQQYDGIQHSTDVGALQRGHAVVVSPTGAAGTAPGVSDQTGSEAVPSNIIPDPSAGIAGAITGSLGGIFNTAVGDLKYGLAFVGVLVLAVILFTHTFSGGGGGGVRPIPVPV